VSKGHVNCPAKETANVNADGKKPPMSGIKTNGGEGSLLTIGTNYSCPQTKLVRFRDER
jgi:hypothetical protein